MKFLLQRILILTVLDSLIVALAVVLSYFLRFDFHINMKFFGLLPYVIIMHVVLIIFSFRRLKLYNRLWQYASIGEMTSILKATTQAELLFFVVHMLLQRVLDNFVVPRSIYLLAWAFIVLGIGSTRFAWRTIRESYFKIQPHQRRALIVGAGKAGILIARELKHSSESELFPIAFVDDDKTKIGLEIIGISVLGGREVIPRIVADFDIQNIIIAMPSVPKSEIAKVIEICKSTKAKIKILPRVSDLLSKNAPVKMIREVSVDDLLGRDPVQVDLEGIGAFVTKKVVLVTGAGGSIGSELCRQICNFNPQKLLLLGHGENSIYDIEQELRLKFPNIEVRSIIASIQDTHAIHKVFKDYLPNLVFHAAAYKHVPLMEHNPSAAIKNNVLGTRNVANCAHEFKAERFVMISTDKAVKPTSIMGVTKKIAEMYIQSLGHASDTKFVAVRFGNVLGSRGSVIPLFKKQIQSGGPVTVTSPEMVRYFMTIPEAVQLVIQAGALAQGGELFILDMGQPVKIADLARDLIKLSGFDPDKDIQIAYTGVRPGEKLYEELFTNDESVSATKHDGILISKPQSTNFKELQQFIKQLEELCQQDASLNYEALADLLSRIVPNYNDLNVIQEQEQTIKEIAMSIR